MTIICDTSVVQYLHQLGILDVLRKMSDEVIIPTAVVRELERGRERGIDLPDIPALQWISVREPARNSPLPSMPSLGPGETGVLAVSLDTPGAVAALDDRLARLVAESLHVPFTGTLGLLLDAKLSGLTPEVRPLLDKLNMLRFRVAAETRAAVLKLAGESDD